VLFLDFVHRLMFSKNKGPNRAGTTIILLEDGNRSNFRNVVVLENTRRCKVQKHDSFKSDRMSVHKPAYQQQL
jgi:hypothetical protein